MTSYDRAGPSQSETGLVNVPTVVFVRERAAGAIANYCSDCSEVIAKDSTLLNAIIQQVRVYVFVGRSSFRAYTVC